MENVKTLQQKYTQIATLLAERYGYPTWRQHLPPVDELVDCILSQNTSDRNRDIAYDALKAKYKSWEDCRDAPAAEVIDLIRPAGLSNTKGPVIQSVLRQIGEERGEITLDFLTDMPIDEAKAYLTKFNGVGPKTAAIVLLFSFQKPAFPVDTHVYRVTQRLGLISPRTSREQAHVELEQIVPSDQFYQAHLNIIEHGRKVCKAPRPLCGQCPLTALCDFYQASLSA